MAHNITPKCIKPKLTEFKREIDKSTIIKTPKSTRTTIMKELNLTSSKLKTFVLQSLLSKSLKDPQNVKEYLQIGIQEGTTQQYKDK